MIFSVSVSLWLNRGLKSILWFAAVNETQVDVTAPVILEDAPCFVREPRGDVDVDLSQSFHRQRVYVVGKP